MEVIRRRVAVRRGTTAVPRPHMLAHSARHEVRRAVVDNVVAYNARESPVNQEELVGSAHGGLDKHEVIWSDVAMRDATVVQCL